MTETAGTWMLQLLNNKGQQVYLERDPAKRYDETSPRFNTIREARTYRDQHVGRFGWVYEDSGEWRLSRLAAADLHERIGDRYHRREW